MLITERRTGDEVVLLLSGCLMEDDRYRPGTLTDRVDRLTAAGSTRIALDLANLLQVDALGLGEIAAAFRRARDQGVQLWLRRPTARIGRLLSVTRLSSVIAVATDEGEGREEARDAPPGGSRPALES